MAIPLVAGLTSAVLCAFTPLAALAQESAPSGQAAPPVLRPDGVAPAPPADIAVTLNNRPIAFPAGQVPVQSGGSVLVPLRGVFEALGASVKFDAATKTINAVRGDKTITLRLGDATGQINGSPVPLAAPAQVVSGATLVPLRFVAEAFGAQVKWEAAQRTVTITTNAQVADKLPIPKGDTPVTGTITGVFPEASAITVRVAGGDNTRIPLTSDVTVLARKGDEAGTVVPLLSLKAGDQVTVKRNAQGQGIGVEVVYDERRGVVKSIETLPSGSYLITLTDGSAVTMAKGAPARMNTNPIAYSDIKAGESVVIRINPNTNEGIGLAVATSDNPAPVSPVQLDLSSVTHDVGSRTLKEGEIVTVSATGTPGATGTFTVSGVPNAFNIAMKEDPAGTYTGTLTVPGGVTVAKADVAVTLALGPNTSAPVKATEGLTIDSASPILSEPAPAPDATLTDLRPYFSGTFSDAAPGTGVDDKSVRLTVNGQDVTTQANVTGALFAYRPTQDLPSGRNVALLTVRDKAGNETKREWAFTLAPVVSPIKVVTVSPEGRPLRVGDTLQVHMEATPGGQAKFSVGTVLVDRTMAETTPGVYDGVYAPRNGDSLTNAKVVVTFTPADLAQNQTPWTRAATQTVSIAAGGLSAPIIDLPAEGQSVGSKRVTISGRAQPGATVRLTLRYDGKIVAFVRTSGNAGGGTLEVKADETTGAWQIDDVALDAPRGASGLKFTLEAVAVQPTGEKSAPATVRFKR